MAIQEGQEKTDIDKDINTLSNGTIISALSIYYTAIIHSQLFEIKLNRHQHHQLLTLFEITSLKNYSKSFVSYHDRLESKIRFHSIKMYIKYF